MKNSDLRIYVLMSFVPLFWGGAFGAAKHVLTEISPITAAALRFGVASLLLLGIVVLRKEWSNAIIRKKWRGLSLMAITGIFAYNIFFFIGLDYTSPVNGSLIMATTPVLVTLMSILFLKEEWSRQVGIGLFCSLAGVILVIMEGSISTLLALSFNIGDALFIAALVSWSIHGLIGKVVMKGISPLLTTTVTMIGGTILLVVFAFLEEGWAAVAYMSVQSWLEMGYLSICATVIAFLFWNIGVSKIGASKASMFMNMVPIHATWIAFALYDAEIAWPQLLGIVLVITGVVIVSLTRQTSKNFREIKKGV